MPINYNVLELISPLYADRSTSAYVNVYSGHVIENKLLALHSADMVDYDGEVKPDSTMVVQRTDPPSTKPKMVRLVNTAYSTEDGVARAIWVDDKDYDSLLQERLEKLVFALKNRDPNLAFQLVSLLSHQSNNKVSEDNLHREHKTSRIMEIKPWRL